MSTGDGRNKTAVVDQTRTAPPPREASFRQEASSLSHPAAGKARDILLPGGLAP